MDFYISAVEDGPSVRRTIWVEHQYSADVATRTGYQITDSGAVSNPGSHDPRAPSRSAGVARFSRAGCIRTHRVADARPSSNICFSITTLSFPPSTSP
jgi:hypothetical protein